MDKAMQNKNEMQEEELYALLDKAMETERLCVSEDLIERTLKRVAESEDTGVISFEAAKNKRGISPVRYMGIAVAAVFVAVLSVNAFGNGGFVTNDVQMEATADWAGQKSDGAGIRYDGSEASMVTADTADAPGEKSYYSRSGVAEDLLDDTDNGYEALSEESEKSMAASEPEAGGEVEMSAMQVTLSQKLAGTLKEAGMAPVSGEAEYWEFVAVDTDWEKELLNSLAAGELWGNQCPEYGAYRYVLEGRDGIRYVMEDKEPLDVIIRIETEQGALWGLLGADCFWFVE